MVATGTGCSSAGSSGSSHELVVLVREQGREVDVVAGGVGDLGLLEQHGECLAARHLRDHRRHLTGLVDRLGELVRVHAVLLRAGDDVLDQLLLVDGHLDLLGHGVEQQLGLERLARLDLDLGAVLVVLEPVLALQVAVHLVGDDAVRHRHVDGSVRCSSSRSRACTPCSKRLTLRDLVPQVVAQLLEGVELAGELGEVVVRRRAARGP